jgi:molybdenum cofactor cytidylyltransferase
MADPPAPLPASLPQIATPTGAAAVLLAAGSSRRLGHPKQLLQFEGESLLRRAARLALGAGCSPVCVVLGYRAARLTLELAGLAARVVVNKDWPQGMGTSVRCGVHAALAACPESDNLLLLVCDQPALGAAHLARLLSLHRASGQPITASEYNGEPGVPAVFARSIFRELLALRQDTGARTIIRRDAARVQCLPWPEGAFDIDIPDDFRKLNSH